MIITKIKDIRQLLQEARSVDKKIYEPATLQIIKKYQYMVHKILWQMHINKNIEDYTQSAAIAIIDAIKTYEIGHKTNFTTWVYYKIRDLLQKERENDEQVKISRYHMRLGRSTSYELDEFLNRSYETKIEDYKELQIDDYVAILQSLNCKLTKMERDIFVGYFIEGKKIGELKKEYKGVDVGMIINNIIEVIRRNNKI